MSPAELKTHASLALVIVITAVLAMPFVVSLAVLAGVVVDDPTTALTLIVIVVAPIAGVSLMMWLLPEWLFGALALSVFIGLATAAFTPDWYYGLAAGLGALAAGLAHNCPPGVYVQRSY